MAPRPPYSLGQLIPLQPPAPTYPAELPVPAGSRQLLQKLGPKKFAQWVRTQKPLLVTDTTMRDAHQSLMAARVRTHDMLRVADAVWQPGAAFA